MAALRGLSAASAVASGGRNSMRAPRLQLSRAAPRATPPSLASGGTPPGAGGASAAAAPFGTDLLGGARSGAAGRGTAGWLLLAGHGRAILGLLDREALLLPGSEPPPRDRFRRFRRARRGATRSRTRDGVLTPLVAQRAARRARPRPRRRRGPGARAGRRRGSPAQRPAPSAASPARCTPHRSHGRSPPVPAASSAARERRGRDGRRAAHCRPALPVRRGPALGRVERRGAGAKACSGVDKGVVVEKARTTSPSSRATADRARSALRVGGAARVLVRDVAALRCSADDRNCGSSVPRRP